MTPKEFLQGWTLLLAQPYGAAYRKDADMEKSQRLFWQQKYLTQDSRAWAKAVTWWIEQEDHFPLIPEMTMTLLRCQPPKDAVPEAKQVPDGVSVPVAQADLLAFAIEHQVTVFEAVKRWPAVEAWVLAGRPVTPQEER